MALLKATRQSRAREGVTLPEEIISKAKKPIERMLEISKEHGL